MYRIVDFISTEKDFESMRYLLIMCQTYFFLNKQGEKFYLVRYIENHKLFQSNEFWEFYFSDSIFQEIEKQNKNEQPEHETKEENTKRFGNIVFSKLLLPLVFIIVLSLLVKVNFISGCASANFSINIVI